MAMASVPATDATKTFLELVQLWIKAHPVSTSAVSPANVALAAAKILLKQSNRNWMASANANLAAILLVLFVNEGLQAERRRDSEGVEGDGDPQILGIGMSEVFEMVETIISANAITRTELLSSVAAVDKLGTTTEFVCSQQLAAVLFAHKDARTMQPPQRGERPSTRLSLRSVWARREAAWELVQVHEMIAITFGFVVAFWTSSRMSSGMGRTVVVAAVSLIGWCTIAVIFPSAATTPGFARLSTPLVVAHGLATLFVVCYNYMTASHVNRACEAVHALLCLAVGLNSGQSLARLYRRRRCGQGYGWIHVRTTLAIDGLSFVAATLALRWVGPPQVYPPGQVQFHSALARGFTTLGLAVVGTQSNRHRVKKLILTIAAKLGPASAERNVETLFHSMSAVLEELSTAAPAQPAELSPRSTISAKPYFGIWGSPLPPCVNKLPCAESAQISQEMPPDLYYVFRRKLAQNFTVQRAIVSALALSGPLLHSLFGEWEGILFTLGTLPGDTRLVMYTISVYGTSMIIAAAFPINATSDAGAKFCAPIVACSALRCIGVVLDVRNCRTYLVNSTCSLVHLTASAIIFSIWLVGVHMGVRARLSWQVARCVHVIEGSTFVLCTVLLRILGPVARYPPGNMSFVAALARGVLPVLLGGFILTPQNRIKFSQLANHLGFNHVTLSLGELTAMQSDIGSDNAVGWEDRHTRPRSDSLDTPEEDNGPCSSVSHHTAKLCDPSAAVTRRYIPVGCEGRQSDSFSEGDACSSVSHHTAKLCDPSAADTRRYIPVGCE